MSLKAKTLNGVKWTSISTIFVAVIQLLQLSILARYLMPSDFGLLALVLLVIGFTRLFSDLGVSNAIIHKQQTTHSQLSTLYWFNIIVSIVLFLFLIFLSPFIGEFYNESNLSYLINIASFSLIIQSLGKQFFVLFEKELLFNLLAKIKIFSSLISFIITILLVVQGLGVMALIIGVLIDSAILSILYIYNGLKIHKPGLIFNLKEVKDFINFGLFNIGSNMINYFNSQMDVIIIGKLLGSESLGVYSLVKQFIEAPTKIINPIILRVSFPVMSKVQHDINKVKDIYLKIINYISSVSFPIYGLTFILSDEIVSIFLGEKWSNASEIMMILSIYFMFRSIGNPIGSLILAMGKPQYEMYWNISLFFYIPIVLYISSQWGIIGISYSWIFITISLMIPNWYFLVNKLCGASFTSYFYIIIKVTIITTLSLLLSYLFYNYFDLFLIKIFGTLFVGTISTIIFNFIFNNEIIKMIKGILK